jgi:hypothetical protein
VMDVDLIAHNVLVKICPHLVDFWTNRSDRFQNQSNESSVSRPI